MKHEFESWQTPLSEVELDGLIPTLAFKSELDQAEAENILQARTWLYARAKNVTTNNILKTKWVKELHRRMFDEVWDWAGQYRKTNKNIGVDAYRIATEVETMLMETKARLENIEKWNLTKQQIAIELSHKAVQIHPFSNGNGRWSRDLADVFLNSLGEKSFTWGITLPRDKQHQVMIAAVKRADNGYFDDYLFFATH